MAQYEGSKVSSEMWRQRAERYVRFRMAFEGMGRGA
jgi:hypothetical protein